MRKIKKALSCLVAVLLVLSTFPTAFTASAVYSGNCGDSLWWEYDPNTLTLTVSGTGAMYDYSTQNANGHYLTTAPWREHADELKSVVIENSVTSIGYAAFLYCDELTDVTIGSGVETIGGSAFGYCKKLANVTIGSGVTTIAPYAFGNCDGLTNVTIPESVTSIGNGAFGYCVNLTEVTIHAVNCTQMGSGANNTVFKGCTALQKVTIGNAVTTIPDNAFRACTSLTELSIGSSVTSIGSAAFYHCSGLTEVDIPSSVTSIGDYAFYCCSSLPGVTIPNGVTSIGDYTFYFCTGFTCISIPDSVTVIGKNAFARCSNLTSVVIPVSVTSIDNSAFSECTGLADVYYTGTQQQWSAITIGLYNDPLLNATLHVNYLPVTSGTCGDSLTWVYDLNTFTLTVSGTGAMYDYSTKNANGHFLTTAPWQDHQQNIQSVVINSGVTAIGAYAFCDCSAITDITIGGNVTSIGYCAFSSCTALTNVTLPDSVLIIGAYAFCDCTALTSVNIPNNVTAIGEAAFCNCDRLTSVTIPDGAANIELSHNTFESCDSLTSVAIGNRVTSIGDAAFLNCSRLTSVTIPDSVTSIDNYAFEGCSALTGVTIPDCVTSIGVGAFNYSGLTSVTIGSGVTSISEDLFAGCSALTSVTIPNSVTGVDAAVFFGCTGLADVYYTGTQQQWSAITIGENNDPLLNATLHLHEHTYTANVTTPATCTQDGVMTYTCACGDAYTEPIAATGHTPQTVVTVPAACTETGLQHEECEVCRERLGEDVVIPANGHTVGAWQMIDDPTPTSTGRMCQYCAVCGALLDEMTVPMLAGTHVTGVALSSNEEYLNIGESLTLTAAVTPETATNKAVLWTSSKPGVATVENGVVTPVAPGITVIIAQTVDNGYKDFCVVQVNAVTPQNGAVLDDGMIYGLSVNTSDLTDCLNLDDETMFIKTDSDVIGTGTKVYVMQGDTVINEFETVIFGDIDGNAWYDGTDAYFVSLVANGMVSEDALSDAQLMAADCNHDGSIDRNDVALLEQAGMLLTNVDQNATNEELQVNSVYLTYCGLIDQTIEITEPAADEEPQPAAQSVWSRVMAFFSVILNWLLGMFKI